MIKTKFKDLAHFTPRQKEFWRAIKKYKFVLYGGAKGGGKSYALRWILLRKLIRWAMEGKRGVRVGLFCEDYPSLKDRQITKINKEFPAWLGTLSDSQKEGMSFVLKPEYGGGVIALRNLDDPSKYASSEFAIAAVDELTKNNREMFDQLRSIIRWPGIEDTRFIAGTNPGGKGNFWVKKLWMDRIFTDEDPKPEDIYFVKSLPTDNPHNAKSYLEELQKLPEKLRKAYYDGNWDVFEGQYFTEWDKNQHVIKPFEIPKDWKRFRSYDYGREKPCCCSWYALDYDGRVYKYREFYKAGLDADQQAKEINRLSAGEEYEYSVADSAIFAKTGVIDKWGHETIAEVFIGNGITFIPASKRRIDGWNLMHQYLRWSETEKPKLMYFETCPNSISTIPSLVHSEIKPEDLETDSEDHCLIGDTLVDTTRGQFKIKDLVEKTGSIYTCEGIKHFRNVRSTGKKKVIKLSLENGKEIVLTPNHKVLTQRGWIESGCIDIRADYLIQLDISTNLIVWKQKLYQKLFKILIIKDIISAGITFKEMVLDFIELFGSIITGKYPTDTTYTTKIIINQIIESRTLSCHPLFLTYQNTQKLKNTELRVGSILKNTHSLRLSNGINLKQEENGTVRTQKSVQKNGNGLKRLVQFAERIIKRLFSFRTVPSTAIRIVKLQPCGEEEVYNLTVPIVEHFTVNGGLVVHNCADTDRYFLMTLHGSHTEPPKTHAEQKMIEMQKQESSINNFYFPE